MKVPILSRLRSLSSIDRANTEKKDEEMKHNVSLDFASAPNSPTSKQQTSNDKSPSTPKSSKQSSSSSSSSNTTTTTTTTSSPSTLSPDSKKTNKHLSPSLKSTSSSSSSMRSTPSSSVKNTPRGMTPRGMTPRDGGESSIESGSLSPIGETSSYMGGEEDDIPKSSSFFSKFISNTFSGFSIEAAPDCVISSRPNSRASSVANTPNMSSVNSRATSRRQSAIQL